MSNVALLPGDDRFDSCPVCNNYTLERGDVEDFGRQTMPDGCQWCGYIQPKGFDELSMVAFVRKCWELQIDPWQHYDGKG